MVLDIERYPGWWKNFRRVKVTRGDGKSVGSVIECEVQSRHPAGDHTIVIGTVIASATSEGSPLLYYRGGYATLGR